MLRVINYDSSGRIRENNKAIPAVNLCTRKREAIGEGHF